MQCRASERLKMSPMTLCNIVVNSFVSLQYFSEFPDFHGLFIFGTATPSPCCERSCRQARLCLRPCIYLLLTSRSYSLSFNYFKTYGGSASEELTCPLVRRTTVLPLSKTSFGSLLFVAFSLSPCLMDNDDVGYRKVDIWNRIRLGGLSLVDALFS